MFEEKWHVQVADQILKVTDPQNHVQQIKLVDIKGIAIQTDVSGPAGSDVTWFISDGNSTLSFPMGATGEDDALKVFQEIDGFDNEQLINAMGSTKSNVFVLLNKSEAS
jgi:hypothetical protein